MFGSDGQISILKLTSWLLGTIFTVIIWFKVGKTLAFVALFLAPTWRLELHHGRLLCSC